MQPVDMSTWVRREAYEFFSAYDYPYAQVTSPLSLGALPLYAKKRRMSFYGLMSYLVLDTLNNLEVYHYGLENGTVVRYPALGCSFTTLDGSEQICFSRKLALSPLPDFMERFCQAKADAEQHRKSPSPDDGSGIVYISCVPWIDLAGMQQPMKTGQPDSVPRVTWGKYLPWQDGFRMHMTLQVHHGFQDGKHIADFFLLLQKNIDSLLEVEPA